MVGWFMSWVPDSVFSAGGGRGSEAWYNSALDIEEVLSGAADSQVVLVCLAGFGMLILSIMLMFGCVLSLHLALVNPGLGMGVFLRVVP